MEQKFRNVKYINPKRRSLYTIPTWILEPEYIDPKYMPVIFNERKNNSYGSFERSTNNYTRSVNNHNRQTDSVNSAQIERNLEEGIFDTVDWEFINQVKDFRRNTKMSDGQPMTQKDLANKCNISVSIIQAFEAGEHILSNIDETKIKKTLYTNQTKK